MEREWSCYRCGKFMKGEWSCCRGGHFNGGRMVMLQKWPLYWRENGHVTMWFYGGRMFILQRCSL